MITKNKIEANLYLPLYIYKWDLDLFERLYCCCLDFQPHWLLLTFRPLLAIPACFKSPKRDNCLLVYVLVSTLTLCVLHMYLSADAAVHVSILDWKVFPNFNWNNLTSQWKFVTFPISGFCYIYTCILYTTYYSIFSTLLHLKFDSLIFHTAWHNRVGPNLLTFWSNIYLLKQFNFKTNMKFLHQCIFL